MLQELHHESFGFQINDILFMLKLYAIKGDNEKVVPVVDFTISQGDKKEEATGFRIHDLHFMVSDKLHAIQQLFNNYSGEDNGYNKVEVVSLELDYYFIRDYHLKFLADEDGKRVEVRSGYDVLFKSNGIGNLHQLINSIEMINEGITKYFIKHDFPKTFFEKYSFDSWDPKHELLLRIQIKNQ